MKLRTKFLMLTAAAALSANMAFAAIDVQAVADGLIADGYTYVEVKTGPTQTKVDAIKGDTKLEVIYDNATGAVIKQETGVAGSEYVGRTGIEIASSDKDFGNNSSDDDANDDNGGKDDNSGNDDTSGNDDNGDKGGDDNGGSDGGDDSSDGGDDSSDGGDDSSDGGDNSSGD